MSLRSADTVADCTFLRPDGSPVRLSAFPAQTLVLIFLRHLAWLACRAHLGEVQKHYEEIRRLGAEVLAVSFAKPERVAAYVARYPFPFPVLADPSLDGYRAFDLGRTSWGRMLNPLVLLKYLALMVRGWLPAKPTGKDDLLQLGGDFVLDDRRRLVYAYRSADPTDRPSAEALLQAVRSAAAPGNQGVHDDRR